MQWIMLHGIKMFAESEVIVYTPTVNQLPHIMGSYIAS